jgi:hypothetical protein
MGSPIPRHTGKTLAPLKTLVPVKTSVPLKTLVPLKNGNGGRNPEGKERRGDAFSPRKIARDAHPVIFYSA